MFFFPKGIWQPIRWVDPINPRVDLGLVCFRGVSYCYIYTYIYIYISIHNVWSATYIYSGYIYIHVYVS